ncbi:tRNA pseudouridine synthase A isoform X1 [Vigna umbellata]|uniref:tRNA pseudouridine synthase A isoform X1 n=1 Tax=Vigna umbellata TaxID=87088 RepID=UPI001F5F7334|nr:tRNA pseudouridine synthase A isoform X1 [Vigna umbellata]
MTHSLKHSVDLECSDNNRPSKLSKIEHPSHIEEEEEEEEMNQNPKNGIQRYLFAIEYIGTRFSGSQKQLTCRTVVGALEEAFAKFVGQPVSVSCSSRTDAGVHALSNVCHVDIQRTSKRKPGEVLPPHEPAVVGRAVNHFLQKHDSDLTIIDVRRVPSDFHARFKAQERTYFYRLLSGPEPLSTFEKDRAWHVCEDLNVPAMQEACRVLVGCHDFSSFRAAGCQAKSPIRTLDELSVTEVIESPYFPSVMDRERHNKVSSDLRGYPSNSGTDIAPSSSPCIDKLTTSSEDVGFGKRRRHRCLVVTARARSFLYHQVRLLVGVLKAVGSGNLTIPDVERILNAKSVTSASPMAPACGLYLGEVKYDLPTT